MNILFNSNITNTNLPLIVINIKGSLNGTNSCIGLNEIYRTKANKSFNSKLDITKDN